jgi:hypothetical protein
LVGHRLANIARRAVRLFRLHAAEQTALLDPQQKQQAAAY